MSLALVDPIVGEVAALPAGSGSTLSDTGQGYDVAIGGLGFKLAISDERKYERATAQFRKEQFDSSNSYGDQSLLGYWTVGQFSFHKGAGVKYYEPTDETVVNRFKESQGVDPFSELGEVSLEREWTDTTTSGPFSTIVWAGAGNGFFALRNNASFEYATSLTGPTTVYTPTAGSVNAACVGPLCAYVGTSSSKIERVGIAAGAPATAVIYTHTTNFLGIFYAKDRLWAVDQLGVWYQLNPNPAAPPVAIGAGDKVFTAGDGWDSGWCLTDTPGPVLIGNGPRIYAVSLNDTGAVPALSGPVQVAELPPGEVVRGLAYHLGFLAIKTSKGARIGVVSDTGQVTYGPLLIEWPAPESSVFTTIARRGSSVFMAGGAGLYEIDLSKQVGNGLEFGWAKTPDPYTDWAVAADHASGVFTFMADTLVAWAGRALGAGAHGQMKHEGSNLAASGSLTTGFLRMGTLEPKAYQTVRVRFGGTGGTITVYRINSDGSETSLYTIDVLASTEDEITLGLSSPVQMVGLKFVLTRSATDATKGPTLLGYQLRALPAPKRQRLIRLPVLLMDAERRGVTPANGHEGGAWERLQALEDMEQSGGTFQFQDFRTGEAGTVYIESIEHAGTTPPGKQSNGFGGFVFLTLRKL